MILVFGVRVWLDRLVLPARRNVSVSVKVRNGTPFPVKFDFGCVEGGIVVAPRGNFDSMPVLPPGKSYTFRLVVRSPSSGVRRLRFRFVTGNFEWSVVKHLTFW